ncbi:symmetrical bis(5'-nucleosyl)-tetraphosphatase [Undibacterium oligocarboniphilum]|uniref:bis(5'-nucleosyl)-tetraphosphatase (symmetrical) n=1 Tax=Undibacterium oligocarboniphilum TaxID=666702 RepID=A0A850QAZ7_9BURK|nr:symmetrical bis(5'-nucleosyl)-tetraphosphatase [Undibacterium oligocarboniphilum]MBC3869906.1 symmetrical bis(5'-nucleosyl)-tetraphosphatase [Undibacterium oligocarboniphilum]NVO77522.1 symmetrical bis(5'-nucleosyl)-tetraphosphatase [Undibacterium oligocarboniphilum]
MPVTYFIGDIQGCATELRQLLTLIEATTPDARYLFAGDLVNRGPESLDSLRLIRSLQQQGRADSVLGNHDLHLLAVAHGIRPSHKDDTLQDILQAPDREALLSWLRQRPMAIMEQQHLLIHAGLYPAWSASQTLQLAGEVENMLRGDGWLDFLRHMYGNQPDVWNDDLQGDDRLRCIINALTRMRFCDQSGRMDFTIKDGAASAPPAYLPWFDLPRRSTDCTVVFGHWSTLGLVLRPNLISLDTGCVWGGKLTAVCLETRQVIQIDSPQHRKPGR